MKILAVLTDAGSVRPCLDAAVMAGRFDSHVQIEALHVVVDPDHLIAASEEVQFQRLREASEGTARDKARAVEAEFLRSNAAADDRMSPITWEAPVGAEEELILQSARDADLIVLLQGHDMDSGDARHAAIRATKKPLLLVPASWTPQSDRFAHIAVALSDTPIAADAIDAALPWLQDAAHVTALRIGTPEDEAVALADRIRTAGVDVDMHIVAPEGDDRGAQIVHEARAIGADLLVAGAYRHGPLVEWLLGGTTRHMLAAAELPLFLAH
ncbi:universal stress protein [Sphingobium yanoikuyae]|uniref:Universal stress protein n=1 Tax=Sphingobium yanoikuyae TaxID=13690 RepID=A0A9X7UBS0_SPHYA|nr:universal stress protein [Sphingobium yanoikuyae]QNG43500.1 universal stress protein [Sphingobium yanoikuyae]